MRKGGGIGGANAFGGGGGGGREKENAIKLGCGEDRGGVHGGGISLCCSLVAKGKERVGSVGEFERVSLLQNSFLHYSYRIAG